MSVRPIHPPSSVSPAADSKHCGVRVLTDRYDTFASERPSASIDNNYYCMSTAAAAAAEYDWCQIGHVMDSGLTAAAVNYRSVRKMTNRCKELKLCDPTVRRAYVQWKSWVILGVTRERPSVSCAEEVNIWEYNWFEPQKLGAFWKYLWHAYAIFRRGWLFLSLQLRGFGYNYDGVVHLSTLRAISKSRSANCKFSNVAVGLGSGLGNLQITHCIVSSILARCTIAMGLIILIIIT